jgi:YbbR domain-containing protein
LRGHKKGISENASYKVVALLITLILWVIILGSKEASIVKMIPTNYILPRESVIVNGAPTEVGFRLTGPRLPLKRFSEGVEPLVVDLSSASEGTTTVRIHPDSIDVPAGIRVLGVAPTTLTIKIEKLMKSKVPIEVILKGKLPAGKHLVSVKVEPEEYEISGPRTLVEKTTKLFTEPINLDSIKGSISQEVSLTVDDAGILKKDAPAKVNVKLEVN